jgi:hypothetical protein
MNLVWESLNHIKNSININFFIKNSLIIKPTKTSNKFLCISWIASGTRFIIDNVLFSTKSSRNLLSFKNICRNEYHINIANDNGIKYLYVILNVFAKKQILKKTLILSSILYYTRINTIKFNAIMNQKFNKINNFIIWHD